MAERDCSRIGVSTIRHWAKTFPPDATILDLGCGHGIPISKALIDDGFSIYGVDASPSLAAAFHRRFPSAPFACEAAEDSDFFGRSFDGIVAIGLVFLLAPAAQEKLITRVAKALKPGARFLFTAPTQCVTWKDIMTGRESYSLGAAAYERLLFESGLVVVDRYVDEGENHYYSCVKV